MTAGEPEIEHKSETVYEWVDGSRVTQDLYRWDPVAPWTHGPCESYCNRCGGEVGTPDEKDRLMAVIDMTNHIMQHMFADLREAFGKLSLLQHGLGDRRRGV